MTSREVKQKLKRILLYHFTWLIVVFLFLLLVIQLIPYGWFPYILSEDKLTNLESHNKDRLTRTDIISLYKGFIDVQHAVCVDVNTKEELPLAFCHYSVDKTTELVPLNSQFERSLLNQPLPSANTATSDLWNFMTSRLFKPRLNRDVLKEFFQFLSLTLQLGEFLNSSISMVYGTALGSLRHGGLIPWDDDLDFNMALSDFVPLAGILDAPSYEPVEGTPLAQLNSFEREQKIRKTLNSPEYSKLSYQFLGRMWWQKHKNDFNSEQHRVIRYFQQRLEIFFYPLADRRFSGKIVDRNGIKTYYRTWNFPFVDIYVMIPDFNAKQFIEIRKSLTKIPFEDIRYQHRRPYDHMGMLLPRGSMNLLYDKYDNNVFETCKTHSWDHQIERLRVIAPRFRCSDIYPYFPFVRNRKITEICLNLIPLWMQPFLNTESPKIEEAFWKRQKELANMIQKNFGISIDLQFGKRYLMNPISSTESNPLEMSKQETLDKDVVKNEASTLRLTEANLNSTRYSHEAMPLSSSDLNEVEEVIKSISQSQSCKESGKYISLTMEEIWQGDLKIHTYLIFGEIHHNNNNNN